MLSVGVIVILYRSNIIINILKIQTQILNFNLKNCILISNIFIY
jgi:hypothetical protein